jgi:hypothetical protein
MVPAHLPDLPSSPPPSTLDASHKPKTIVPIVVTNCKRFKCIVIIGEPLHAEQDRVSTGMPVTTFDFSTAALTDSKLRAKPSTTNARPAFTEMSTCTGKEYSNQAMLRRQRRGITRIWHKKKERSATHHAS